MRRRYPIPTRKAPPRREIPPLVQRRTWRKTPSAWAGCALLGLIALLALLIPWISPYDPIAMAPEQKLQPPSLRHPLGTDLFGRDVATRTLYGARISIPLGIAATLLGAIPGLLIGMISGYYGGWIDSAIMRLTDIALAFPKTILALGIVAILRPGLPHVALAIGLASIPGYVRIVRGTVLSIRRAWYVRAAQSLGCSDARILFRHILPNVITPIAVLLTLDIAWSIIHAASLNFLGLGAKPPTPEWGAMINEGRELLRRAPWVSLAPAGLMSLTVLAINLIGESLREATDPLLRQR